MGKADLLGDQFDGKQSRESVDLPLTCHQSSSLATFAFRSSEVRQILLELDPCGGTDQYVSSFLMKTVDVLALRLVLALLRSVSAASSPR